MNIDDPKLTAFALDELDEPERSAIAREVSSSPEAQRYVEGVRQLARALKSEFAAESLQSKRAHFEGIGRGNRRVVEQRSLVNIQDEPLFWSVVRPLAAAAAIAILAIVAVVVFGNYKSAHKIVSSNAPTEIQAEESRENLPMAPTSNEIPNPLRRDVIQRVEQVVIGEVGSDQNPENGQVRVIEIINDAYRLEQLKRRVAAPVLSRKSDQPLASSRYELIFLDHGGRVVAGADFYQMSPSRFVLQPRKSAYQRDGKYFVGGGAVLPGEWQNTINYAEYVIDFPDWQEAIGYAPRA
jgi:hypothetical protein